MIKSILKAELIKNIIQSAVGRYSVYIVNIISMIILARIFSPEVFGVVAISISIFVLFQLLAEGGIATALINVNSLKIEDRNGIFTVMCIAATLFAVTLFLSKGFLANFFIEPSVSTAIGISSIGVFFIICGTVPLSFLYRDTNFYGIALVSALAELISTIFVVVMSFNFTPIIALSAKIPITAFIKFIGFWILARGTEFGAPVLGGNLKAITHYLKFSIFQYGFNIVNYIARNADNFAVAKKLGVESLGLYDKAYQLMKYPLLLLSSAMTPAIQPTLRKHINNREAIGKLHDDLVFYSSTIACLLSILYFYIADYIVLILLGDQWGAVVPLLQIFSFAIPIQVLTSTSGAFFLAFGRADLLFYTGSINALIVLCVIIASLSFGNIYTLCWSLVFTYYFNSLLTYTVLYKVVLNRSIKLFFLKSVPLMAPIIAAVLMVGL